MVAFGSNAYIGDTLASSAKEFALVKAEIPSANIRKYRFHAASSQLFTFTYGKKLLVHNRDCFTVGEPSSRHSFHSLISADRVA